MFNDSQNIEAEPGAANAEAKDLSGIELERAKQWAESFPEEPNPWVEQQAVQLEQPAEANPGEQPDENPVAMSADTPNQLRNTTNQVTNAIETSWNAGDGGASLSDSYDSLRGKINASDVQQLANEAAPTISRIEHFNDNGAPATVNTEIEAQTGDNSAASQAQIESDMHDLAVGAGTVAFGAQAAAENAIEELSHKNESDALKDAEQQLVQAQQQIEHLTEETAAAARAVEGDTKLVDTATNITGEAQELVEQAQKNLQEAAEEAETRQQEIKEHQTEADALVNSGAMSEEELNQSLSEGQSIENLVEQNAQEVASEINASPNIQSSMDPIDGQPLPGSEKLNPELTTPVEDDRDEPLISIFG